MNDFKKLRVWQQAMKLTENVYDLAGQLPADERFALKQQMLRSAVSVPSNIAEGAGRNSKKQFSYFVQVSIGSLCELETQVLIAQRMKMINSLSASQILKDLAGVQKMSYGLMRKLNANLNAAKEEQAVYFVENESEELPIEFYN